MAKNDVQNALVQLMEQNPDATNEQLAVAIRHAIPGSTCSPASVSSMKSRLKAQQALGTAMASPKEPLDVSGLVLSATPSAAGGFQALPEASDDETLEEATKRILLRYKALERMSVKIAAGKMSSLIISGPPGLGKSHTMECAIAESDLVEYPVGVTEEGLTEFFEGDGEGGYVEGETRFFDTISGSITAVGLYIALWNIRKGGLLFLDDIDEVFRDEVTLNLLKAALDSGKVRKLSWRKEANWLEDYGIPKTFEFKGHVVFATNIDFEKEIEKGHKMSEHFKALIDRSMYLCLSLRSKRDFMIRIRQVAEGPEGMLQGVWGLTEEQEQELLDFVAENRDRFYNLSLRLVGQIADCMLADPEGWVDDVTATKMRSY